jgi:hypothetical protein
MEAQIASGIEPGIAAFALKGPAARAIVEIDPHDLPEPPGGWIELVLDDGEEDAAAGSAPAAPCAGAIEGADPAPPSLPALAPKSRVETAAAPAAKRWFLVPEALVVGGFVLFGALLLGALLLLRAPRESPAPAGYVSAPVEVTDPASGRARRAGRGGADGSRAGQAPAVAPAGEVETPPPGVSPLYDAGEPIGADSPVAPESPPAPNLAPWRGPG